MSNAAPPLRLYGSITPNVQKVIVGLAELQLEYELILVNLWKGELQTPEFTRLNPNNKVPVLIDRDGPGMKPLTVFESGAILLYLAEKTGKLLPREGADRYAALQWLMFQMASVGPMGGQFTHFRFYAPAGNDYSLSRYTTEVRRIFDVLDRRLAEAPYLAGQMYSIADIAVFPWVHTIAQAHGADLPFLAENDPEHPNLWRWHKAVFDRPALADALERIATIPSHVKATSPEERDRIFGRGRFDRSR